MNPNLPPLYSYSTPSPVDNGYRRISTTGNFRVVPTADGRYNVMWFDEPEPRKPLKGANT